MGQDAGQLNLMMLKALEALYISRKTTLAAARLGLAQPSMSVYLRQLRELTGDALFIRTSRGLEPTDFCHSYYKAAREVLDAVEILASRKKADFDPHNQAATFSVAIPFIKGRMLFDDFSAQLAENFPRLKVDMISMPEAEALRHLEEGLVDLYIGMISDRLEKHFSAIKILKTELIVLCSEKSPHYRKGRIDRQEYLDTPHIKATASLQPSFLDEKFKKMGLLQKTLVAVPDIAAEVSLLQKTNYLLVIDRSDAEIIMAENKFRILKTDFALPQFDFYCVWHARNTDSPPQKWYRNHIRAVCREYAGKLRS